MEQKPPNAVLIWFRRKSQTPCESYRKCWSGMGWLGGMEAGGQETKTNQKPLEMSLKIKIQKHGKKSNIKDSPKSSTRFMNLEHFNTRLHENRRGKSPGSTTLKIHAKWLSKNTNKPNLAILK